MIKNPLSRHLPPGLVCFGMSQQSELHNPMHFATTLPDNTPIGFVIGTWGFSKSFGCLFCDVYLYWLTCFFVYFYFRSVCVRSDWPQWSPICKLRSCMTVYFLYQFPYCYSLCDVLDDKRSFYLRISPQWSGGHQQINRRYREPLGCSIEWW